MIRPGARGGVPDLTDRDVCIGIEVDLIADVLHGAVVVGLVAHHHCPIDIAIEAVPQHDELVAVALAKDERKNLLSADVHSGVPFCNGVAADGAAKPRPYGCHPPTGLGQRLRTEGLGPEPRENRGASEPTVGDSGAVLPTVSVSGAARRRFYRRSPIFAQPSTCCFTLCDEHMFAIIFA